MSCLLLACAFLFSQAAPAGPEVLNYVINWPSGLSLGDARFEARQAGDRMEFTFTLDAALPGFTVNDRFRSVATRDSLCSLEFEKQFTHGKRKANERTAFDLQKGVATRETLAGGGKSEISIPACPKDALTFLYFVRRELSQGRLPPAQTVYYGAAYQVRVDYGGVQNLRIGEAKVEADRLLASLKGPASQVSFEVFFARDAGRTPVLVRVPFAMGSFSMELVK
jgi:hypothetical protein